MVITDRAAWNETMSIYDLLVRAAGERGTSPPYFSVHVYGSAHEARRREIESFLFQEADRDKIVLLGEP